MTERAPSMAAGFFGKLPERGDFLCRRLPANFIRLWDPWLQAGIDTLRRSTGNRWLDAYLVGPTWRFVLTAGVAGPSSWCGVLMPSVDRAGRYFPLTVAAALPDTEVPLRILHDQASWFDTLERLSLEALEERLTVEQLDSALLDLGSMPLVLREHDRREQRLPGDNGAWRFEIANLERMSDVFPAIAHRALTAVYPEYSLWCANGTEHFAPSILMHAGLPAKPAFCSLYTGDWSSGGWVDLGEGVVAFEPHP